MSRAFIKEDVDVIERTARRRSQSGLPPGALNYMTRQGAEKLRARLAKLRRDPERNASTIEHIEEALKSATLVEPRTEDDGVSFGASVTVEDSAGKRETYRVVGVDEVDLDPGNVSWVSPIGKALLAARRGQRVTLPGVKDAVLRVVSIDWPSF
jgi:transcription elongation GreA/GreB family factor